MVAIKAMLQTTAPVKILNRKNYYCSLHLALVGSLLEMAWAAKRPANEPLTGLFIGPLTARFNDSLFEVTWRMQHLRCFFLANGTSRFMHTAAYALMLRPHHHTTATCRTLFSNGCQRIRHMEDSPQRRFATQRVRHTNVTENLSASVGQTLATVPMQKIQQTTVIGWGWVGRVGVRGVEVGGVGLRGGWGVGIGGLGSGELGRIGNPPTPIPRLNTPDLNPPDPNFCSSTAIRFSNCILAWVGFDPSLRFFDAIPGTIPTVF